MGMNVTREPYFQPEDANLESLHWNDYLDALREDGFTVEGGPNQWSILGPSEEQHPAPSEGERLAAEGAAAQAAQQSDINLGGDPSPPPSADR